MNLFAAVGRLGVRAIDFALRRYYRVFLFSDNPECVLRVARATSPRDMILSDGTRVARGEPIIELHFWNERLPALPRQGAALQWGIALRRRTRSSLRELAAYLAHEPRFDSVRVLHGEVGFLELKQFPALRPIAARLGFDFCVGEAPGWRVWKYAFWQNLYAWWLMWAFNPASLRGKHFAGIARGELWMSRAVLMEKYSNP